MKIPMNWIKQYTPFTCDAQTFQDEMIMHGTGVEGLESQGETVQNVVVGRILSVQPHENSDHMLVCQIDVGKEAPIQIVTGAPNVHVGDEVPVALEGAILPNGVIIKKGNLRGVDSFGMCCSGPELGVPEYLYPSVGDKGLLVFQEEYKPGTDVRSILGIDDVIADFEILANRPDCLSVWGIAREAAATFNVPFNKPQIALHPVSGKINDFVKVEVQDEKLCPRYVARVIKNVKIEQSPMWMRKVLHAAGIRAINNIVDITNYVMLETGHPMHAFDLDKVKNQHIIVRRARPNEEIVTIDGKKRELNTDMLMIADQDNATGIAGVMGGEESEISDNTRTVMFEVAAFDRTSIRLTTRELGMRTEASGRFERGVCPATCREAVDRACQLVEQLNAGEIIDDVYDYYPSPVNKSPIVASVSRINRIIGMDINGETMAKILNSLFMKASVEGDQLTVVVPEFRSDIENEADLSEEVLRIYGYDHIGSTLLRGETAPGMKNKNIRIIEKIGRILSDLGMFEIKNFSFISPREMDKLNLEETDLRRKALALRNPLGEDTSVMRTMLLPSMLETVALNQKRNNEEAYLFEISPVFDDANRVTGQLPAERLSLCIGAYGEKADFFDIRDKAIMLLSAFGLNTEISRGKETYLHPGRTAILSVSGEKVATIGELHPDVMKNYELTKRVIVAEIDVEKIASLQCDMGYVKPLPKFPAVTRDLALVMNEDTMIGSVQEAIYIAGQPFLEKVSVFDIYRGAPMLPGTKSVAFSLKFRTSERTLSDEDVNPLVENILKTCKEKCGAVLRL